MGDLAEGETVEVQGSAKDPYVLSNLDGAYACTCPAWRNQSRPIDLRTCKHLKKLRGAALEEERVGKEAARGPVKKSGAKADAPALLLAHSWQPHEDPSGWWMSEKLDGVRAYWDGQRFVSRLGNPYLAPPWFSEALPPIPLDGELWVGRGRFQETVSVVRRAKGGQRWKEVRYLVFDSPGDPAPFEERYAGLGELFPDDHPYATRVAHEACRDHDHLTNELARIEGLGGEGLMLRQPGSRYETGRSTTLLKVKSFHDAEARVVGYVAGRGKHKGKVGSLKVVTPGGIEFSVGTGLTDFERSQPPELGAVISYRYQELTTKGVPRFPSYLRLRSDVEWSDLQPDASSPAPATSPAKNTKAPPKNKAAKQKPTQEATPKGEAGDDAPAGATRYFEFCAGTSNKFWEVSLEGNSYTVRYGRIGTTGQSKTKEAASPAAAEAAVEKLVSQKTGKGYTEAEPS